VLWVTIGLVSAGIAILILLLKWPNDADSSIVSKFRALIATLPISIILLGLLVASLVQWSLRSHSRIITRFATHDVRETRALVLNLCRLMADVDAQVQRAPERGEMLVSTLDRAFCHDLDDSQDNVGATLARAVALKAEHDIPKGIWFWLGKAVFAPLYLGWALISALAVSTCECARGERPNEFGRYLDGDTSFFGPPVSLGCLMYGCGCCLNCLEDREDNFLADIASQSRPINDPDWGAISLA